jgi:hypothetical protein
MPSSTPKVFISYSHDSPQHEERVLGLAERLRLDGIDAQIDQYILGTPQEGWPRWMLNRLDWADFVLLICTELYYQRFRGADRPDRGRGADWEGQLVTLDLYNAKSRTVRFVPLLFSTEDIASIPEPLRGHTHYVLAPQDPSSEQQYVALYRFLTGQADTTPGALGALRTLASRNVTPLSFGSAQALPQFPAAPQIPSPPIPTRRHSDSIQHSSPPLQVTVSKSRSLYLTYASADRTEALQLADTLRRAGCKVTCRSDLSDSSGISLREVANTIGGSDLTILVWSDAASDSARVTFDYHIAIALRRPIILCLLDDAPLTPPFDRTGGIKIAQSPELLAEALNSLPENIAPPSPRVVKKVLRDVPDESISSLNGVFKQITNMLAKHGLVNPRRTGDTFAGLYIPDSNSKSPPLHKRILLGLGGVVGAAAVAALGWLSDPKNLSTAVDAGQHMVTILSSIFHLPSPPTSQTWEQYVPRWKQEILHRQMQDGGFRITGYPMSSTQAWTSAQCLRGLLSGTELVAISGKQTGVTHCVDLPFGG